jgi:glucosyl-3-phosphoglycerate synthase
MQASLTVLWVDNPEVDGLFPDMDTRGLSAGYDGKGQSCWLAYGYLLACNDCEVIALHDCDILNYNRELIARLCRVTKTTFGSSSERDPMLA